MSKGSGKKNTRGVWMAVAFAGMALIIGIEMWLLFRKQWELFDGLMNENPIMVFILFLSPIALPVVVAMKAGTMVGTKVGDEAEKMARNLRP